MISQTELIKLIREHTGCGMWDAKRALENIAQDMGVITRRDRMAMEILNGLIVGNVALRTSQHLSECVEQSVRLANELSQKLE